MSELNWRVELTDGRSFAGTEQVTAGAVHIRCLLPEGIIRSVTGEMCFPAAEDERVFFNGFQSWSYSPEYTSKEKIRGLSHLPALGVRRFGLDRYGDNYFLPYPEKKGVFHGETWAYFRRGKDYRLVASLDEEPGYTIFRYDFDTQWLRLERDCSGLRCGGDFPVFDLYYAQGEEKPVFDGWFDAMGVKPRTLEPIAGYSSWYNRYEDIDEECIWADLDHCAPFLEPGDLFQVDDGWEPGVGDWLEPDGEKFPSGMKAAADAIHEKGYRAGLWLAPFVARKGSKVYTDHPDWLLKIDGKPWYCGCNWGGFYSLDIDHPEVRDYLTRVFRRVLDEWGFDLVKLDFLYGAAPFGNEKETRAGRMIRAMDWLRELCGDKLILGCGVPLAAAFGRVDYCRIGCDVGLDWDGSWLMQQTHRERVSTRQSMTDTVFRRQLNGRAFLSDPDVFFLRTDNCRLSQRQKAALAETNTLLGGVFLTSDDMAEYDAEQAAAYRRLRRLRKAQDVRVETDRGVLLTYTIDGAGYKRQVLPAIGKKL